MKNFKGIIVFGAFFALSTISAVDPGLEIYNKSSQPIAIALLINGQVTEATVGANKRLEKAVDLKSPIRVAIGNQNAKKTANPFLAGALIAEPSTLYDLKASGKTKYVTWDPTKAPYLFPQVGKSGKTDSGYSLRKNLKQSETLPVSTAVLPTQPAIVPAPPRTKPTSTPRAPATIASPTPTQPTQPTRTTVTPVTQPVLSSPAGKINPRTGKPLTVEPSTIPTSGPRVRPSSTIQPQPPFTPALRDLDEKRSMKSDYQTSFGSPKQPTTRPSSTIQPQPPFTPALRDLDEKRSMKSDYQTSFGSPKQPTTRPSSTIQPQPPFTPALKDLDEKRSMKNDYPTSFGSPKQPTIKPVLSGPAGKVGPRPGQPLTAQQKLLIEKNQGAYLGMISIDSRKPLSIEPQQGQSAPLSDNIMKFIENNQEITANSIDQDWLMQAVSHILNGNKLTEQNKDDTEQKLIQIVDILVAAPLRSDLTITDDAYAAITSDLENRIITFMDTLEVVNNIKKQTAALGPIELGQKRLNQQSASIEPIKSVGINYRLPSGALKFVEESKQKGMAFYFKQGRMNENWLTLAAEHILQGNTLTENNKDIVMQQLEQLSDMLVGVGLRSNTKISDDEYNAITAGITNQIRDFVNDHMGEVFVPLLRVAIPFIENSKKRGESFYLEQGRMREDWLDFATGYILQGTNLIREKKDTVIQQLTKMSQVISKPYMKDFTAINNQIISFVNDHMYERFNLLPIGIADCFEQGRMREDWLKLAIEYVLNRNDVTLTEDNKYIIEEKVVKLSDMLVGSALRTNTKISDDEYNSIINAITNQIGKFIDKTLLEKQAEEEEIIKLAKEIGFL